MIWYFLAGVIAGIVGTVKYSRWWVKKHTKEIIIKKIEEDNNDRT